MSKEEAIEILKAYKQNLLNSCSNQLDGDIEAFDIAIKALDFLSTVTEDKFHDISDSLMLQYKQGWNEALEALKIKWEAECFTTKKSEVTQWQKQY